MAVAGTSRDRCLRSVPDCEATEKLVEEIGGG